VVGATLILPYSPLASLFQFSALPLRYLALLAAIVFAYIASADVAKRVFYKHIRV
jgi:Mg2+-importing ATPase